MTADLPARILAAIEADETTARAAAEATRGAAWSFTPGDEWSLEGVRHSVVRQVSLDVAYTFDQEAAHIARHDPARVLARCAADRQLVEILHRAASEGPTDTWNPADSALVDGLRALAAGYGIESEEEA